MVEVALSWLRIRTCFILFRQLSLCGCLGTPAFILANQTLTISMRLNIVGRIFWIYMGKLVPAFIGLFAIVYANTIYKSISITIMLNSGTITSGSDRSFAYVTT